MSGGDGLRWRLGWGEFAKMAQPGEAVFPAHEDGDAQAIEQSMATNAIRGT